MTNRVGAVIPAAGQGQRMGRPGPKPFLLLNGLPILAHTLKVFESATFIDDICVVVPKGMEGTCRAEIVIPCGLKKVMQIIAGGETRQESVYEGLLKFPAETDKIVIHDGVRPLLPLDLLQAAVEGCREDRGVVAVLPVTDTLKAVGGGRRIVSTVNRADLYIAQTPQVFPLAALMEAHRMALREGFHGTDDSMLMERAGFPVEVIWGDPDNIKITTARDLERAEVLLERRFKVRGL